jgi:hypothetical protein
VREVPSSILGIPRLSGLRNLFAASAPEPLSRAGNSVGYFLASDAARQPVPIMSQISTGTPWHPGRLSESLLSASTPGVNRRPAHWPAERSRSDSGGPSESPCRPGRGPAQHRSRMSESPSVRFVGPVGPRSDRPPRLPRRRRSRRVWILRDTLESSRCLESESESNRVGSSGKRVLLIAASLTVYQASWPATVTATGDHRTPGRACLVVPRRPRHRVST